jgi:hypothetical protein
MQAKYIEEQGLSKEKIRDINKVIEVYQGQLGNIEKIGIQNKQLREKCAVLERDYETLSIRFNDIKLK